MKDIMLSTPKFGFIVATRAALALGAGLLLSSRLDSDQRRNVAASYRCEASIDVTASTM